MTAPVFETVAMRPGPAVAKHIGAAYGYRMDGFEPGVHLGMPSGYIVVVISLDEPTTLAALPDRNDGTASLTAFVGGLHRKTVEIHHDGSQCGIQLAVRPGSARALFGMPAGALTSSVVDLDELKPAARSLPERLAGVSTWAERFEIAGEALYAGSAARSAAAKPDVEYAWGRIVTSGGTVRVSELAAETGWSRRHLTEQFTAEFGMPPKELSRMVRFHRSRGWLEHARALSCAEVAARCGYADQAHMTREWVAITGGTPTSWRRREDLPFVQDEPEVAMAG